MEIKELLDDVSSRYDTAVAVEIDLVTGRMAVYAREEDGYPEYLLRDFKHYSDIQLLPPNKDEEETWE